MMRPSRVASCYRVRDYGLCALQSGCSILVVTEPLRGLNPCPLPPERRNMNPQAVGPDQPDLFNRAGT